MSDRIYLDYAATTPVRPEVRDAIRNAVDTAVAEARKKISDAIAEERAKAGLPPTPPEPPAQHIPF